MERIENAALELFAHHGYGHTSISQIAKAAGISKGLMYNYYESKKALLLAIVRKGFEMGNAMNTNGIEEIPSEPMLFLRFFVETTFQQVQEHFHYFRLLASLSFQEDVMAEIKPEIDRQKEQLLSMGTEMFRQLGHPEPMEQALLFAASMDGVFFHYAISPDDYPLERMKLRLMDNFCKKYSSPHL